MQVLLAVMIIRSTYINDKWQMITPQRKRKNLVWKATVKASVRGILGMTTEGEKWRRAGLVHPVQRAGKRKLSLKILKY